MSMINTISKSKIQESLLQNNFNLVRNNKLIESFNDYYEYYDVMNQITKRFDTILVKEYKQVIDRTLVVNDVYNTICFIWPKWVNANIYDSLIIEGIPNKTIFEIRSDLASGSAPENTSLFNLGGLTFKNIIFDIYYKSSSGNGSSLFGFNRLSKFENCVFIIHSNTLMFARDNMTEESASLYRNNIKNCTFISDVNYQLNSSIDNGKNSFNVYDSIFNKTCSISNCNEFNNSYANQNINLTNFKCSDQNINKIAGVYSGLNAWKD